MRPPDIHSGTTRPRNWRGIASHSRHRWDQSEAIGVCNYECENPLHQGYNEDQIAIVLDDPSMKECPVILGTPTLYRAVQVIKESEIAQLAVPWATSRFSYLIQGLQARVKQEVRTDVGNKNIAPTSMDEVVRVSSKVHIPPFGCKAIQGRSGLFLLGYKLNVMTHGLEKRSPQLPLGVEVLSSYATLTTGSNRITVVLRNNTNEWVEVQKGVPIARMVTANMIPPVDLSSSPVKTSDSGRMSEEERQRTLFEKLDLSGLESWDAKAAKQARSLLAEYHDLFSLEKNEIGHMKAAEHVIKLKDPDATPFKEWFRRIPPPQVDEVREHLKLMLDAGAIRLSNSPWCNAVVLVREKDGSLRFCIDFRRLNSLTKKDSHPLPRICETLDSLIGAAYFSTFDLTSGFWQVPMA